MWANFRYFFTRNRVSYEKTYFDRLNNNDGLEEGQKESSEPLVRLRFTPFHTVENGEEGRGDNAEETY